MPQDVPRRAARRAAKRAASRAVKCCDVHGTSRNTSRHTAALLALCVLTRRGTSRPIAAHPALGRGRSQHVVARVLTLCGMCFVGYQRLSRHVIGSCGTYHGATWGMLWDTMGYAVGYHRKPRAIFRGYSRGIQWIAAGRCSNFHRGKSRDMPRLVTAYRGSRHNHGGMSQSVSGMSWHVAACRGMLRHVVTATPACRGMP